MQTKFTNTRLYQNACNLLKIFEDSGYEARLVGGCVRDRLMGLIPHDYDIATKANPKQIIALCEAHNLKAVPTGMEHGTVTVLVQKQAFELTTLRKDVSTDGRFAKVEFGASFKEDAARRDFTINAMSEDRHGQVFDYFAGRKHLKEKLLCFVGDASKRIQEDYLRILRFFRFRARFKFEEPAGLLQTISELQTGLEQISLERISGELCGLFICSEIGRDLEDLSKTGVFKTCFPMLDEQLILGEEHLRLQQRLDALGAEQRVPARIAAIAGVHQQGLPQFELQDFIARFKLSNRVSAVIEVLCGGKEQFKLLQGADQHGRFNFIDRCEALNSKFSFVDFFAAFWKLQYFKAEDPTISRVLDELVALEAAKAHIRKRAFPLNGKTVLQWTALNPGSYFGEVMSYLKSSYRNETWSTLEEAKQLALNYCRSKPPNTDS